MSRVAIIALAFYFIGVSYLTLLAILGIKSNNLILIGTTLLFALFAIAHGLERLGTRALLAFFTISFVVSFILETLGVLTGAIYGPYYYTEQLGAKLGVVPLLIPLAWFMMIYASYTLVNFIVGGTTALEVKQRYGWKSALLWSAWLSLLSAMAMTAWDLALDPQMAAAGHWVWTQGGEFFGVPVQNYVGWLGTTFIVFFLFQLYTLVGPRSNPPITVRTGDLFAWLPVIAYAVQGSATIITGLASHQAAPALAGFFAMGAFLFITLTQVLKRWAGVEYIQPD